MRIIPFRIKAHKDDDNFSDVYEFLIKGTNKDPYQIEIDIDSLNDLGITDSHCTCPDHQFRGNICKHIIECVKILNCFNIKTDSADITNNTQKLNSSVCGDSLDNASVDSDVQKQSSEKSLSITSDTPRERSGVAFEAAKVVSTKVPSEGSSFVQEASHD